MTDTATLRSLADDIDARIEALERDNEELRLAAEAAYFEGFADGANIDAVWKQAQAETLGLPII